MFYVKQYITKEKDDSNIFLAIQGVPKKTEPCIKYAKYQMFVIIAKWKVHGLLHMAFCHILSKFCLKLFVSFQIIVNFRNAAEKPILTWYRYFLHATRIVFRPLSQHIHLMVYLPIQNTNMQVCTYVIFAYFCQISFKCKHKFSWYEYFDYGTGVNRIESQINMQ